MSHILVPADVAEDFVENFAEDLLPAEIGTHLTCKETDALAAMLRALGAHEAADRWIRAHCANDDEGDAHYTDRLYHYH